MPVEIQTASSPGQLRRFIDLPHSLYKEDPCYVPELYVSQKKLFNPRKNPFFRHAEVDYFLACRNKKPVGRIAAIKNGNYLRHTASNDCFFGFFDSPDDEEISFGLLQAVRRWAMKKGFERIIGPVNFSTNDSCALLAEGFNAPPVIQMTYNPPYYLDHIEKFGFRKKMDLLAYRIDAGSFKEKKTTRWMPVLLKRLERKGITIRKIRMDDFSNEVDRIHEVYNQAWEKNWGFVPMTASEFRFAAAEMKAVLDPDFAYLAEQGSRVVGFSLSIPNLNEIIIGIRRGRLFPTGIFRLLFNRRRIRSMRVITLGVIEAYRKLGIDTCFYAMNIETALKKNIQWAEASWILENNELMNRALVNIGAQPYKRYRIYELPLTGQPAIP